MARPANSPNSLETLENCWLLLPPPSENRPAFNSAFFNFLQHPTVQCPVSIHVSSTTLVYLGYLAGLSAPSMKKKEKKTLMLKWDQNLHHNTWIFESYKIFTDISQKTTTARHRKNSVHAPLKFEKCLTKS